MKYLITGITGFAGPHLANLLIRDGHEVFGIDSLYDYDPVWEKCRELKIAPSFHNGARSILLRNSPSNFCYNHIGHFASAGHAVAKALFFGGVTRRFPDLNFAFLEGGVGWACMLYADLIGHWEKRNGRAIESTRPDKLAVSLGSHRYPVLARKVERKTNPEASVNEGGIQINYEEQDKEVLRIGGDWDAGHTTYNSLLTDAQRDAIVPNGKGLEVSGVGAIDDRSIIRNGADINSGNQQAHKGL